MKLSKATWTRTLGWLLIAVICSGSANVGDEHVIFDDSFDGENHKPTLSIIGDQGLVLGDSLSITASATDPDENNTLVFSLMQAPTSMTINSVTGHIAWTPQAAQLGDNLARVKVDDSHGRYDIKDFTTTVIEASSTPLLNPINDQVVVADSTFSLQASLASSGSGTSLQFSLEQAPAGMQIDGGSGNLDWTPSLGEIGSYPVTVKVSNSAGHADTEPFTLRVITANSAPVLAAIPNQDGKPGQSFSLTAQASDADNDPLTFELLANPPGMSIDPVSGEITWLPSVQQSGPSEVKVSVSDPFGFSDSALFTVTIDQNRAPIAVDDGTYTVQRGDTLAVPAAGLLSNDTDPNGDALSALLASEPSAGAVTLNSDGSFEYTPDNPTGTIGIELKWFYKGSGGPDSIPPIIDLNGDGIPEIIMTATAVSKTHLYALHGDTGEEYFKIPYFNRSIQFGTNFAVADIDLDGHPEIIVIGNEPGRSIEQYGKKLMAFDHTGQLKWISEPLPDRYQTSSGMAYEGNMQSASITIADIDQDGMPEILVGITTPGLQRIGYQVWDNQGNKLDYVYTSGVGATSAPTRVEVVDLDLDGVPEIVMGSAAWTNDGELLWSNDDYRLASISANLYPLIANLDDDPYPEMVRVARYPHPNGTIVAWNHDGTTLWKKSYPSGPYGTFGMLSIADVDNDGKADILVPPPYDGTTFQVLNGADGTLKWSQTAPGSGGDTVNTGWAATVMDMDGDGYNEVIYLDGYRTFHIWDGRDGTLKAEIPSGEGGRSHQSSLPIFADLNGDGHAELITIGQWSGGDLIRVYKSPNNDWPPMRAIWNQNSYHVTNINDDGTVPQFEQPHWLLPGLNQNLVNQRMPEERFGSTDSFTYRASDGGLESNIATVNINVLPPNAPPQILSTARLLASPDFEYTYGVLAVDADPGEVLSYALSLAPVGMTIDSNHVIRWTPTAGDLGDHNVIVSVTDSVGVSVHQSYTLKVMAAVMVPDVGGQPVATAVAELTSNDLSANPIENVFENFVPVGQVAIQSPAAGTFVAAGSDVRLDISKGAQPLPVPNVLGEHRNDAEGAIQDAGLTVGTVEYVNDTLTPIGSVLSQDPAPRDLLPPGSPVNLIVSGGPRVLFSIDPQVILAGASAQVGVTIHDVDGTPLDPQPLVDLSIETQPNEFYGTLPSLSGNTVTTAADSMGGFSLVASFDIGMPESISTDVVVMQPVSTGDSADIYSEFGAQLQLLSDLMAQLQAALLGEDPQVIKDIDTQLLALRADIDVMNLRTTTPLAADGGFLPDLDDIVAAGYSQSGDDRAFRDASFGLIALLENMQEVTEQPGSPVTVRRLLNQDLAASAAALEQLDPGLYGVLDGASAVINILGTRLPEMAVANIDNIHRALINSDLVDAPLVAGDHIALASGRNNQSKARRTTDIEQGSVDRSSIMGFGDITIAGLSSATSINAYLMKNIYAPYIKHTAIAMATLAGGELLKKAAIDSSVIGLITGSSIGIHIFRLPNTTIEGFGFDTTLAAGNAVTLIGPELIEKVLDILNLKLPSADDLKKQNGLSDEINKVVKAAEDANTAFNEANSAPNLVFRGCFFDNHPACRQLVYTNGLESVYKNEAGLNLPGPVIFIIRNLAGGGMAVYVANFVPTRN